MTSLEVFKDSLHQLYVCMHCMQHIAVSYRRASAVMILPPPPPPSLHPPLSLHLCNSHTLPMTVVSISAPPAHSDCGHLLLVRSGTRYVITYYVLGTSSRPFQLQPASIQMQYNCHERESSNQYKVWIEAALSRDLVHMCKHMRTQSYLFQVGSHVLEAASVRGNNLFSVCSHLGLCLLLRCGCPTMTVIQADGNLSLAMLSSDRFGLVLQVHPDCEVCEPNVHRHCVEATRQRPASRKVLSLTHKA